MKNTNADAMLPAKNKKTTKHQREYAGIRKEMSMSADIMRCLVLSLLLAVVVPSASILVKAPKAQAQETQAQEQKESYPLHDAIRAGKVEEVSRLLSEQGKKAVSQADSYGMLPLHYASSTGNFEIGRLLLDRYGASPNPKIDDESWILRGRTPLHIAVTSAGVDFVEMLLSKGANPFTGDRNGLLPLHIAVQYGQLRAAKLLMKRMGRKVHALDNNKTTPLHLAAQYGRGVLAMRLIDLNAKVNARNGDGLTPLHYAAGGGHLDLVELLIESGAKVNTANNLGSTPLFLAARDNRTRVVDLLLSERAIDVEATNKDGRTALTIALANGNGNVSAKLLQRGFDVRLRDKTGKTFLHHAANGGEIKALRILLKTASADINSVDSLGNTPLHYATQADKNSAVKELIKAGANKNLRNKNEETAQDIAKELGHSEALSLLR